jgi:hypothetical protein
MSGSGVIRGPESGMYQGGKGPLPKVAGNGKITLSEASLHFDKWLGKPIDIPISTVRSVHVAKASPRLSLIVETADGEARFDVKDANGWAAAIARAADVTAPTPGVYKTGRKPWLGLAVAFTSLGLVLWLVAGISAAVVSQSISGTRTADGIVVGPSGSRNRKVHPVVEFATPSGATFRIRGGVATSPPRRVGSHVGVRYHPNDPRQAVIDDYWQMWFWPTLFGILGTPFFLVGIGFGAVTLALRRRA